MNKIVVYRDPDFLTLGAVRTAEEAAERASNAASQAADDAAAAVSAAQQAVSDAGVADGKAVAADGKADAAANAAAIADGKAVAAANAATVADGKAVVADAKAVAAASSAAVADGKAVAAHNAADANAAIRDKREFPDLPTLLANATLTYGPGAAQVQAGDIIRTRAEGFGYRVAVLGVADADLVTAGGVLLYVLPGEDGFHVDAFGALGDGETSDRLAIYKASQALQAAGGGKLSFSGGKTYIVGGQELTGSYSSSRAYAALPTVMVTDVASVVIEGNGAILKVQDGLKYGAHDPVTGEPLGEETGANSRSHVGATISITGCAAVIVRDLELDGNLQNLSYGAKGPYADQASGDGLDLGHNGLTTVQNVYSHHNRRDGIRTHRGAYQTGEPLWPVTILDSRFEYNGRQGWSHVGGGSAMALSSTFSYTGRGGQGSGPGAGIDIESTASKARYITIIGCSMVDNQGMAFITASSDNSIIKLSDCLMVGLDDFVARIDMPRVTLTDCIIVGLSLFGGGSAKPEHATRLVRCLLTDDTETYYNGAEITRTGNHLVNVGTAGSGLNITLEDCTVDTKTRSLGIYQAGCILRRVHFRYRGGTEWLVDKSSAMQFGGGGAVNIMEDCTIEEAFEGTEPVDGFFVNFVSALYTAKGCNRLISPTGKLKWNSWSNGAGGFVGDLFEHFAERQPVSEELHLYLDAGARKRGDIWQTIKYVTAEPTSGAFRQGDLLINRTAGAGDKTGWFCTTAGEAGSTAVFKEFGAIEP